MTSFEPVRDPQKDTLINAENSVLTLIDFQNTQINSLEGVDRAQMLRHVEIVAKLAVAYHIPVILSTVNVATNRNHDTYQALKDILKDVPSYDRTNINAWEDKEYNEAIKATGRKKILMTGLWTEACVTFPTIDALAEGYEVYPIVDAMAGTSALAHETALRRMEQKGAQLITTPQLICEIQRDWNRTDTVPNFLDAMFAGGYFLKI